jgi:hypothetical protein
MTFEEQASRKQAISGGENIGRNQASQDNRDAPG